MSRPIITIFGATGLQGSSVLKSVFVDGTFAVRAVTRAPESDAAKKLVATYAGVEVVRGDLFDLDSVREAVRGSEVVFGVTNFWDPSVFPGTPNGIGEVTQGKNLVDAAKAEGVKFFVWSGLPSSKTLSNGKYPTIYHIDREHIFSDKAAVWDYLQASGVPCAAVDTGYFAENLWKFAIQKSGTGYAITVPKYTPTAMQTFTWVGHDLGPAVLALLRSYAGPQKGKDVLGKAFPVVTMIETYREVARQISKAIGKEVVFTPIETGGLAELDEMYTYQADLGMYKDTPVPNPALVALGVKFGTLQELVETEIVPLYKDS